VEVTRHGCWRTGEAEADKLSVFYADVDNADPTRPIVTMEDVAARLNAINGPLSFFMYETFSHSPQQPKFRVGKHEMDLLTREQAAAIIGIKQTTLSNRRDSGPPSIFLAPILSSSHLPLGGRVARSDYR
jgi:hypothetical protein